MLEFTWPSFIFAIVNFLILVALLYRFLHRPLLQVLEKRRHDIEEARKEAEHATEEARAAQKEYERKLASVHEERDTLLSEARREAQNARERILEKAREEADREVANRRRDWERQRHESLQSLQQDLVGISLDLARRILEKLTDADLEARLLAMLERELADLASRTNKEERRDLLAGQAPARVVSAKRLDKKQRLNIQKRIQALSDGPVEVEFDTDGDLIAGVRVEFSSLAVDATLADVLAATQERFSETAPEQSKEEQSNERAPDG